MARSVRQERVEARTVAVQALYQFDISGRWTDRLTRDELAEFVKSASDRPAVRTAALDLIEGVIASLGEIDPLIATSVDHWRIERLAPIDRSILRLAIHELRSRPDVPPKVAISEAIELAKTFSTAQSGAFVNGVLDRIWRDLAGGPAGSPRAHGAAPDDATPTRDTTQEGSGHAAQVVRTEEEGS